MQFPHLPQQAQLTLFEAFMVQPLAPTLKETVQSPWIAEPEVFSELSLRGAAGNCLSLLAPILRELSQEQDARWLTLIAPPASLTQTWLRDAGPEPRAHPAFATARHTKRSATDLRSVTPGAQSHRRQLVEPTKQRLPATVDQRRPYRRGTKSEYSTGLSVT